MYPPLRLPVALLAGLLLASCTTPPTRDAGPTPAASNGARQGQLRGQILPPRDQAPPPRGVLQLELMPRFNPAPQALASARIEFDTPPPWLFELSFPRSAIDDPTLFRLDVALFDADGHLRLVSDGEHPVNLGVEAEPTRIELIALDSSHPDVDELDCEGSTVTLQFSEPDLQLSLDAVPHRLRRAHSAVGRRYVGADAELWLQADDARLQLGSRRLSCVAMPAAAR